ncbi:cytochrome c oxidase subunit 3 [Pedobacter metabolipauper]|uniref:Cytochrome c oxidase subunit 3 n=1 Tax=Pedobacter metabolipauper TaxID=425513 RepID=A0A4R6SS29_9SPHI|nr:cytochrome c oxidase subunit 3 [Pedobacter metabolipauper]TDQ06581.1 cytochrome c oxidase subunit 3 [Pedobacter metabolipauper]
MVHSIKQQETGLDYRAKKFVMWLFVVSSTIMFGGWTSYYIVFSASKGKGHGLVLPELFIYSTAVLVLSSISLFLASRALKNQQFNAQKTFLCLTMVLGIVFGYLQVDAWSTMVKTGAVLMNNNAAISLIYIVSGFHILHIFAGICLVFNALMGAYKELPMEKRTYRMEIASIFWHFIDILWIYLYVFLLLNS